MEKKELTHKIIGCAMKVHSTLGNGFQEVIYQRALAIEMAKQGLSFEREMEMDIQYEGEYIGTRRVDFFVEGENYGRAKGLDTIRGCSLGTSYELLSGVSSSHRLAHQLRLEEFAV